MRTGYVTIVGRPNVGKSTLLNAIINKKIAITSDKVQTTRNLIDGIYNDEDSQIIFIDTPGIHKPKHNLGRNINKLALSQITDVDIVLFLISFDEKIGVGDELIIESIMKSDAKKYCIINKIDKAVSKSEVLDKIAYIDSTYDFDEIFPVSALTKDNVLHLVNFLKQDLEEGEAIYSNELITTYSENFMMKEIIREKILNLTHDEIPHSVAVTIDVKEYIEEEDLFEIHATIVIERKSQKGIIIGKQGSMLAKINSQSQREIKKLIGKGVYLRLWVKVKDDWRNNESSLDMLGYKA